MVDMAIDGHRQLFLFDRETNQGLGELGTFGMGRY
jgi:hypothetical protein